MLHTNLCIFLVKFTLKMTQNYISKCFTLQILEVSKFCMMYCLENCIYMYKYILGVFIHVCKCSMQNNINILQNNLLLFLFISIYYNRTKPNVATEERLPSSIHNLARLLVSKLYLMNFQGSVLKDIKCNYKLRDASLKKMISTYITHVNEIGAC